MKFYGHNFVVLYSEIFYLRFYDFYTEIFYFRFYDFTIRFYNLSSNDNFMSCQKNEFDNLGYNIKTLLTSDHSLNLTTLILFDKN